MAPAIAPLPVFSRRPFQFCSGSQISFLTNESADMTDVKAIRQKAGKVEILTPPGVVNAPSATSDASTISEFDIRAPISA
ncbi:hypothetical protein [Sphingobium sp.]|uniref:hypothetical protein n=1 Tax=Sphingobium sp. TaxID=1912891 RepID=UPI002C7B7300|nr:hypothetical protein [Sphingobium sp.]HUD92898.1 hypothetical protein [Sphingobium sp.]